MRPASSVRRPDLVGLLCLAAALAFVLPFGTVACDDESVAFTGLELATWQVQPDDEPGAHGSEMAPLERQVEHAGSALAMGALLFSLGGAAAAFWYGRGGVLAFLAWVTLAYLGGRGILSLADLEFHSGYWIALFATLNAWMFALQGHRRRRRYRHERASEAAHSPTHDPRAAEQ